MRLFRNLLLGLGLLLLLAAGAGVLWREAAVQAAGEIVLDAYGFDQARLTVTGVGSERIIVQDITLGPGLPALRQAELRFKPLQLLRGEVQQVILTGLRVTVEQEGQFLREKLRAITKSQAFPQGKPPVSGGSAQAMLPHIILQDAQITLRATPAGDGLLLLSGELQPAEQGLSAQIQAVLDIGHTTASLTAHTESQDGLNIIVLEGSGKTDAAALAAEGPFAQQAADVVRQGRASYSLKGRVSAPVANTADLTAWLAKAFEFDGRINLHGVQTAFAPEIVSGDIGWRIDGNGQAITIALPRTAILTVSGMAPERASTVGLDLPTGEPLHIRIHPSQATAQLTNGSLTGHWQAETAGQAAIAASTLTFSAKATADAGSPLITLRHANIEVTSIPVSKDGITGIVERVNTDFDGLITSGKNLDLNGKTSFLFSNIVSAAATLETLQASTPFRLTGSLSDPDLIADGMTASVSNLQMPGIAAFQGPLSITASTLRFRERRLTASLLMDQGTGEISADAGKPIAVAWTQALADVTAELPPGLPPEIAGAVMLSKASATVPSAGIRIDQADLSFPLTDGNMQVSGLITDTQANPRFTPITLALAGDKSMDEVTLAGIATMQRGQARVPLRIRADINTQTVRGFYGPATLTFAKEKLQPKDLSSLLNNIRQASGNMVLSGTAAIDPGRAPRLNATVVLDGLSVQTDSVQAEGLSGRLKFSSLQPLATAGEQSLRLARVVAGVPLSDVFAHFTIPRSNRGLTVNLREAGATLAGGSIRVNDAVYQNGAADLLVRVTALPLERLLLEWKVEGLEGTGLIAGAIPVSIRSGGVGIDGGKLDGQQPGVIRVDFGSARDTLTGAGKQVELAVQTLEDFHYQQLSLGISKPQDGELTLAVGLNGNNPSVLDGHPFRFNITLSGRLEPILEAIQAGNRISAGLLRGGLGQ